jgi:hypothetical protein
MKTPEEDRNVTKSANLTEKEADNQLKQMPNQNWDEHMQIDEEGNEVGPNDQA